MSLNLNPFCPILTNNPCYFINIIHKTEIKYAFESIILKALSNLKRLLMKTYTCNSDECLT